jgi:hypothetical protein
MPAVPEALTPAQVRAIRAARRLAPEWGDGIQSNIVGRLTGDGPWDNATVNAAIAGVLADLAIDMPIVGADQ